MEEYNSDSLGSLGSMSRSWSSYSQTSSSTDGSWIKWWCGHSGHEFFVEVPEDYIEDDFNMTGLSSEVIYYKQALEMILDLEPDADEEYEAADHDTIEGDAEILYGLIHARYICSRSGLITMAERYEVGHFGHCPRVLCGKTGVLPCGLYDVYAEGNLKLFCPSCQDVYNPPNSRFHDIDGSYFGPTFPHLFFMTFPELLPPMPKNRKELIYVPRIYGFKVSELAQTGPKMAWLRSFVHYGRPEAIEQSENEPDTGSTKQPAAQPKVQTAEENGTASRSGSKQKMAAIVDQFMTQDPEPMTQKGDQKPLVAVRQTRASP